MIRTWSSRWIFLNGILAVGFLSYGNAQQDNISVREHFNLAQQDQQQGRLDEAEREYKAVLRIQPGIAEADINLGLVYYAQAKFEDSAQALAAAGKLRPGMKGVSLWLGIDNVKLHRPLQAITLLREAIRQEPSDKLAQSWLATALWDAGQTDAALLQLHNADARFPNDPDLLFALGEACGKAAKQQTEQLLEDTSGTSLSDLIYGNIYAEERDWTKAEGHLRRALQRDSHSISARLQLSAILLEQAQVSAAQDQLEHALVLNPQSAAALARSGEILLLMQQPREGLALIERAVAIDRDEALDALGLPFERHIGGTETNAELVALSRAAAQKLEADLSTNPVKSVALAALYSLIGDEEAAQRNYQRIAFARPKQNSSVDVLSQALVTLHQHRYDDAEPLLVRWIANHPNDRQARFQLAVARRRISIEQMIRLLAVAPDSYHVHQLLGQIYASREEDDKALTEYLAVAEAKPTLPGIHFWLGHLYWKHGDADHARAELTRELQLDPGHAEAHGELGAVLVAEEHAVEAIPHLETAIHSKPDLWPAYAQLGRAYAIQKDYSSAEQVLRQSLGHDHDAASHYQLALVLRAEGKTAQAAEVFEQVRLLKTEKMLATPAVGLANQESNWGAKP